MQQLILKALQEKEKMGTLSEEDQKIMEIQKKHGSKTTKKGPKT